MELLHSYMWNVPAYIPEIQKFLHPLYPIKNKATVADIDTLHKRCKVLLQQFFPTYPPMLCDIPVIL